MSAVMPPGIAALPTAEQVLSQARAENFTVASALLGRRRARHLMAIYGFARLVDDVGDEAQGDRQALLDLVELELRRVFALAGDAAGRGAELPTGAAWNGAGPPVDVRASGGPQHPLMRELAVTVRECALPVGPFERLIEANRVDQVVTRYETFAQLLDYSMLSAAPVGELVLGVFGVATPERIALSDRVCSGLQVVEHLQDIAEDHGRGRVYMPAEDLQRFGCSEDALAAPPSAAVRALVIFEAARARALLRSGRPLARTLPPLPRLAVAGFVAGGMAALDGLEQAQRRRMRFFGQLLRTVVGR